MRLVAIWLTLTLAAVAGDGFKPRAKAEDYPAHQDTQAGTLASVVLRADQVKKIFGDEMNRRYIVVEVAVYPQTAFEIDPYDFRLKADGDLTRPETPRDVASVWGEKDPRPSGNGPTVVNEEGVAYSTGRNPATGQKESGVSTYSSVAVTNDPRARNPDPPAKSSDMSAVLAKLHDLALPEGRIRDATAGYLYFPKPSKKAKDLGLVHSRDGKSVTLTLANPK